MIREHTHIGNLDANQRIAHCYNNERNEKLQHLKTCDSEIISLSRFLIRNERMIYQ